MNINAPEITDIKELRTLWKEAFSDTDEFLDMFFSTAFSAERSFCIKENNEVTAALHYFDCLYKDEKIAYIYAVATKKSHRGQGLCRKLMDYTHNALKTSGCKGAILVPGSASLFDFYEKMGYKTCCYLSKREFRKGESCEPVQKISADDYALLRREHLPCSAVIQEGKNLSFLSTYAEFYKGEDFLFTASKEDQTLICHEFLGNIKKAPGIIKALNLEKGRLRTIGSDTPFAMYLPFEGKDYPDYFSFAFD